MTRKTSSAPARRSDGGWFALCLSALIMVLCYPQMFVLAGSIMDRVFPDARYEAEYLILPIFVLTMLVGFFGLTVIIKFLPKLLVTGFVLFR